MKRKRIDELEGSEGDATGDVSVADQCQEKQYPG